jgi:hypothetical protein
VPAQPLPEYDAAFTSAATRVRALLDDASAWTGPVLTSGVNVYMPAKEDPVYLGARGDCILSYSARTLLSALEDPGVRGELDGQLDKVVLLDQLGPQAKLERMLFKSVFPTDPRDFVAVGGWRVRAEINGRLRDEGVLPMLQELAEHSPRIVVEQLLVSAQRGQTITMQVSVLVLPEDGE